MVTINGQEMTQSCWVYDQVISVLPEDRVAVNGRGTPSSGAGATYELPELPRVYRALNTLEASPSFIFIKASDFHDYEPNDEYTPLTNTEWSCN